MLNQVHVTWDALNKKWVVKSGTLLGGVNKTFNTKEDAVTFATSYAKEHKAELFVHNQDGKIAYRNSYGNDPFPPKG